MGVGITRSVLVIKHVSSQVDLYSEHLDFLQERVSQ